MQYNIDYYKVLGVRPDADSDVIRAAYKTLIYKHHPDRNKNLSAVRYTVELTEAMSVIGNTFNRNKYDYHRKILLQEKKELEKSFNFYFINKNAVSLGKKIPDAIKYRALVGFSGLILIAFTFSIMIIEI